VSERYIIVRNWEKHQHKDIWKKSQGRPPWIKVYTQLLYDDAYMQLPQRLRGLLHGIWMLYASSGGVVPASPSYIARMLGCESEWVARARRERGESVASSGREDGEDTVRTRDLKALEKAGFIEFKSRPIRYQIAPRSRREVDIDPPSIPPTAERLHEPTEAEIVRAREDREKNGYVEGLSSYTGCRIFRGEGGISHIYDPLGTEPKPIDWPYPTPTRQEILEALARRKAAHVA